MLAGSLLWRPADDFRRIAEKKGENLSEWLAGLNVINARFGIIQWLVLAFILLNLAHIVRMLIR